jgi:hypothetical protein
MPPGILRGAPEQQPGEHAQGHVLNRQQREHRDEHELRGHRRAGSDLEVDPRRDGVRKNEQRQRPRLERARSVRENRKGRRRAGKCERECERCEAVAAAEMAAGELACLFDQQVAVEIAGRSFGHGTPSCDLRRHGWRIGPRAPFLDRAVNPLDGGRSACRSGESEQCNCG